MERNSSQSSEKIKQQNKNQSQQNQIQDEPKLSSFFSFTVQKWLQIFFVTLITLGPFICSYGISSVKEGFKEQFNLNDLQYNTMQSSITFVTCAFSLFCGVLTDKIGLRKSLLAFSVLCLCGYTIQFVGIYLQNFYVQCIGQTIGYINLNGLTVIQGPLISRWVDKKQYGFCLSITFLSVRFADVISSWTYPPIYENTGHLYLSFLLGVILLASTLLIGSISSFVMDLKAEKRGQLQQVTISDINIKHAKYLNFNYVIVVLIGVLGLSSFYAYYFNSQTILKKYYHIDGITSGRLFSIPFFVSFSSPIFGFVLDKIKSKASFLIFSASQIVLGYTIWILFYDCQKEECYKIVIPAYIFLGIFLSTFTNAVWYCVFLTTPSKVSGTAYGLLVSSKNLGIALFGMLEGYILDQHSVFWAIMHPLILSALALIISTLIFIKNKKEQFLNFDFKSQLEINMALIQLEINSSQSSDNQLSQLN
ncbi:MFS transporter (macronuclear) [Tetrahymena thermophila SB210]|uniref:Lysosomal dipeptide transporter MFSD1 n=1 Tax=Tetrahymena thermophila (strain SB210) TaxID=312017 RepID=W7X564_TETTS|nr:MFS transporter [Tetrahymena thermophila SB210]EWS72542.1 MFS transporter [Tetrahymena thermophila SB210]|eukprot:XP_012654922.1 MFS transporter [Tetrahymena thermophila SB210]